ncbi:pyruvate kinase [Wenyingzhuangia heitensis]|uniref:Pyruvate kinase n=1 Tax=Wenyingzhuangia heitensis TaxID=1487859 RepID=A0ABX0U913_9FLAO|nr:pyruvate kinase [Wenyingzhuangia heitensis]NIJ43991.1 pyruvate kinase [Wenyingzhuangia heitensis]
MSQTKKTKIVATLGPALTGKKEKLRELMISGVNVFRINFSHADEDDVTTNVRLIRELNEELDFNVAILADLQGPKLRVGVMAEGVELAPGDVFNFTTEKGEGNQEKAFMTYQRFPKDVKVGEKILVDDGKLLFEVTATNGIDLVTTKVLRGGPLKSKKGVNLPNTNISLPALTEKDIKDAKFALSLNVDWMALSFVRNPADLDDIHKLIAENSDTSVYRTRVISKIEKPEALENIDAIIANTDAIMVARGDLGVEIPMSEVPLAQKMLVRKCKEAKIPVVIATQMMETMIENSVPTRAEVNDVANSIMDGADAVMLSGETSVGAFPNEVIKVMRQIILDVENSSLIEVPRESPKPDTDSDRAISNAICHQAALVADDINAKVISTITNSGYTAQQISALRPKSQILAFSSDRRTLGMMNIMWGVKGRFYEPNTPFSTDIIRDVNNIALESGYLQEGDIVVNLTSTPIMEKGDVNTLRISKVDLSK